MAYLTITRISGDPSRLTEHYHRSSAQMSAVGHDHGILAHAAAPTEDGLLIMNLWPSQAASESAAEDPRRIEAMGQAGLTPDRFEREHYPVLDHLVLGREQPDIPARLRG